MNEDCVYDTEEFLKNFPGHTIQYFTDDKTSPQQSRIVAKRSLFEKEEATKMQEDGCGVFFTINGFASGERKKKNLYRINAVCIVVGVVKTRKLINLDGILLIKSY
ncbi:MAG: hypothetical protein WC178_02555 [Candidatus Paceibacterota bacterium]